MKAALPLLLAMACAAAAAQTPLPGPASPGAGESDPMIKRPAQPGMDSSGANGSVVVPPSTGNEEIAKEPRNVDPKMDDATRDIDKQNRKQLEDKAGKR